MCETLESRHMFSVAMDTTTRGSDQSVPIDIHAESDADITVELSKCD